MRQAVKLGLENLLAEKRFGTERIGLLCNQASVNHNFEHAADLLQKSNNFNLTTLFGPQHGIRGDVQDNMIETGHSVDSVTRIPIYSLYSETREPTAEMLQNIDVLVCDMFDVGCRVYTFIYTIANCMRAAGRLGKKVVVCDRPNPVNGNAVEGNLLNSSFASFVGQFPIPMRHGLTVGELALMFQKEFKIECELEIVKMQGWQRDLWFDETDAPWVMPSPNMPTIETAAVFPGTVMLEGTQISEGRGTTRPFEIVGAPYINAQDLAASLNRLELPGALFRPNNFMPTFQKHAQKPCGGVQIQVINRHIFKPFLTGVALVQAIYQMYPDDFAWKTTPYEYVYERNPFDVINGTSRLREMIEQKIDLFEIELWWQKESAEFLKMRSEYLLY
ncbi:MAG: DUF1343 domain-containing protein [Pyrinomonadaceae bacterium]